MKLWDKGYELNQEAEAFTVQGDHLLDQRLVPFDCEASIAHAKMLRKMGILEDSELHTLIDGLNSIAKLAKEQAFIITLEDEDCHTAIENYLTKQYGPVGKKIHTARSRNDQVLTALRLYEKAELQEIDQRAAGLVDGLEAVIQANQDTELPGYSHMQKAMPSSVAMWLGSFVESARDNRMLLKATQSLVDQSPLGTGAGFGIPGLEVDRKMTAELLGFERITENPMYAQLSRGKFEAQVVHLCSQILLDLNRLATDLLMFSMAEFQFISLPKDLCTGSSIMPQKRNADILELIRAKYHTVLGEETKIKGITANLISGYHRDLQLTKEPLFNSLDATKECLRVATAVIGELKFNKKKCKAAMTEELYAVEEVYRLVKKGLPFREAYQKVAAKYVKEDK